MSVQPTETTVRHASGRSIVLSDDRLLSALATLRDVLTPGQALNVPAVLDRSALLACLSALLANAFVSTTSPVAQSLPWKQLRISRGWSQLELFRRLTRVAAQKGEKMPDWPTFKRNLSRWESGTVTVSPFYRDLLVELFDLNGEISGRDGLPSPVTWSVA